MSKKTKLPFSIKKAISFGFWRLVQEWKFYIPVILIFGLISYLPALIISLFEDDSVKDFGLYAAIIIGLAIPIQILIGMGVVRISLLVHDTKPHRISDLVEPYMLFFNYIAGTLVYAFIVLGGLILLIVPGLYWLIRFQYYSYLIIDKKLGPIEALRASYALTQGVVWRLIGFHAVLAAISAVSAVVYLIGPVIAAIFMSLSIAFVYRKLLRQEHVK